MDSTDNLLRHIEVKEKFVMLVFSPGWQKDCLGVFP
jgi:hypothetical protein